MPGVVSLSAVNQARSEVQDLITLGIRDVSTLVNELSGQHPETIAQVLAEFLPAISDTYGLGVAERAADFYLEQRTEAMVTSSFTPPSIVLPDAGQVDSLARYAAAPAFTQEDFRALVKSRAVGGLSRILTGIWADTFADFGAVDSSPVRYQRMPRADCCAFAPCWHHAGQCTIPRKLLPASWAGACPSASTSSLRVPAPGAHSALAKPSTTIADALV